MVALATGFVAKKRKLTGTLGDRLRLLLSEKEWTVTDLANATGVHRVSVSRIVNGKVADPAVSVVKKMAEALEVSASDLIDD